MATSFEDFLASRETELSKGRGQLALGAGATANPDQAAEAARLGRRFQAPTAAVEQDLPAYRSKAAVEDSAPALATSPRLAAWLAQHPNNPRVAHDDVGTLSTLESKLKGAASAVGTGIANVGRSLTAGAFGLTSGLYGAAESALDLAESVTPTSLGLSLFDMPQRFLEGQRKAGQRLQEAARPQVENYYAKQALAGVESVPVSLGALATGLAAGPAAALGIVGGSTYGTSAAKGKDAGLSPVRAALYGGIDAAVEVATEALPLGKFISDTKMGASIGKRLVHNIARELPGEQAATLLQNYNQYITLDANKGKTFGEYVSEIPEQALATAISTIATVGATNGVITAAERGARLLDRRTRAAEGAGQATATLQDITDLAAASKLRTRDVPTFEAFVAHAAEDGPVQDVFIDARTLRDTLEQSGADPADVLNGLPSVADQFEEAIATGGDVRIPVGEFAARLADSDAGKALLPHLRADPEGMSQKEADDFFQSAPEELRQAVEQQMTLQANDEMWRASTDKVKAGVLEQLAGANRFTPDVNDAYATMLSNFYAVTAARVGVQPEEMAARYPVKIQAEGVEGDALGQGFDTSRIFYHETDEANVPAITRDGFDLSKGLARLSDHQTPDGVFVKPTAKSIGLGSAQIPVHVRLGNNLKVIDRDHLGLHLRQDDEYNKLESQVDRYDRDQAAAYDEIESRDIALRARLSAEGLGRKEFSNHPEMKAIDAEEDAFLAQWQEGIRERATKARARATAYLKEQGYQSLTITNDAGGFGRSTETVIALDGNQIAHAETGRLLFQGTTRGPRGAIAFGSGVGKEAAVISLMRNADLSTFLHESGHFFLEVLNDIAVQPDAPAEVASDMNALLKWFGHTREEWNGFTLDQKRKSHELFARGFETYLFEGKAPNLELKSIFQRFSQWLLQVYRHVAALNAPLNDEVRSIFDRMVATQQQILDAEEMAGVEPFITEKPTGMSDEEYVAFQKLGEQATQDAISDLQSRSLKDMRWSARAQARELKRLQKDVAEKRKSVRAEAEADVAARPLFRAIDFLRRGTIDGVEQEGPTKLSIVEVKARFQLADADFFRSKFGYGKYGMLAEDGINPEQIAELFGFTSADHLLHDIVAAPDRESVIEAETEQKLLERYGDITSPQALERAVAEAVHNDVRGRFIATELAIEQKAQGKPRLLAKAARDFAAAMVGRLQVRNIRPAQYEAAERRAARAALTARKDGDTALAATEKRNQLVNFYATKAAREAQDEIAKALTYFRKFGNAGTRQNLDVDYIEQIDDLLDRYELRPSISDKRARKSRSLAEWIDKQREAGFEPIIDPALVDEGRRIFYRDMTLDELRGLIDAVRNIEHLGRLKKKLLTSKDEREFAVIATEVGDSIGENAFRKIPEIVGSKSWFEGVKAGVRDIFAMHRKVYSLVREMDGGKDGGPFWTYFVQPMNEAADREAVMTEQATIDMGAIFKRLRGQNTHRRTYVPEIGKSLSLEDRLMVALNMGNSANIQRLEGGDKWTAEQRAAIVAPLDENHWGFVQDVWNYIDTFWPEIAAKSRRVSGVVPEKVQAEPLTVTTADGKTLTLKGGYFPIKYDPDRSSKAAGDTAAEVLQQMTRGAYTAATTRRGHEKARVAEVNRPLRKDFGVIFGHVSQVIHDLTHHEFLIDANRLMRASQIDGAIREGWGPNVLKWMSRALEDIAVGTMGSQNAVEQGINYLRTGATIAGLGWNIKTALLQPIGLVPAVQRVGPKWMAVGMARIFRDAASMEASATWVHERSAFMRLRAKTQNREISEIRNRLAPKGLVRSRFNAVPGVGPVADAIGDSFFVLIAKMQMMADMPVWVAQYEKSMASGEGEERAARLADQAVLDTQGGGQTKDLSGIQRGGPLLKLWTNFYSYFNVQQNLIASSINTARHTSAQAGGGVTGALKATPQLAVDFFILSILPTALASILGIALAGGDDDDDEIIKKVAADQLSAVTGNFVFGRELQTAISAGLGVDGARGYSGPAGARFFSSVVDLSKQVNQGEADEAAFKAANSVAGVLFHYPSGQVQRTVLGSKALAEGEAGIAAPLVGPPPRN